MMGQRGADLVLNAGWRRGISLFFYIAVFYPENKMFSSIFFQNTKYRRKTENTLLSLPE
jgi:hypothetical protein